MADQKKRRLVKIRLNEISLVDFPAEKNSQITIFKRADDPAASQEGRMSDLAKMVAEMETARTTIETLTKRVEDAEAGRAAAEAKTAAAEAKVTALGKAAAAGDEPDEDQILKAADPVVAAEIVRLRKANAAAAKQLSTLAEEKEIAKAVATVRADFGHLPIKPEDFGPVFKRAMGALSAEDSAELVRVLKAADNAMVEATTISATAGGRMLAKGSAETAIEAKAREIEMTEKVSFAKAYDLAMTRNPELYSRFLEERGGTN